MFRKIFLALALIASSNICFAQTNQKLGADNVTIGNTTNTNKQLKFDINNGSTNPALRANKTTNKLEFSHDSTVWKAVGSGSGGDGVNLLADNRDFESGISTNWTASAGGTVSALTGSNALFDNTSARFNAGAADQTYTSDAYTVPVGLQGSHCLAGIHYKTSEDTNKYKLLALDGDDDSILGEVSLNSTNSLVVRGYVGFECPTAGTVKLQVKSTGDAADIDIDNAHLGSDVRVADVSQAQLLGTVSYAVTANCAWTVSNQTSLADFPADTDCPAATVTGSVRAPDTKIPGVKLDVKPGHYFLKVTGYYVSASADTTGSFRWSDGTTGFSGGRMGNTSAGSVLPRMAVNLDGTISYAASQSNVTFRLQGASAASNSFLISNQDTNLHGPFTIAVYYYPTTSEVGLRVDQLGWRVDANISGANPSLGGSAVTSYTGIEDAGLTLSNNTGNGVIAAQIPCSGTNAPTGTTCAVGNESVGISFNVPTAGDVVACASFSHNFAVDTTEAIRSAFQIVETPSNAQTISQEGKSRVISGSQPNSGNITAQMNPLRVCGNFTFSSSGQKTLRLFYEQSVTGTVTSSLLADADANNGQRDIHWEVYPVNYLSGAMPILNGMVTSQSTGRERVERLVVTISGGTPAITSQSGSWVSSITDAGVGLTTINIASGVFSATPTCVSTPIGTAPRFHGVTLTSSTEIQVRSQDSGGSAQDHSFALICMGPN